MSMIRVMINTTDPVMVSAIGHIPMLCFESKQASDMPQIQSCFQCSDKVSSKRAFQLSQVV